MFLLHNAKEPTFKEREKEREQLIKKNVHSSLNILREWSKQTSQQVAHSDSLSLSWPAARIRDREWPREI